jgi:uncharacterized protein
MVTGPCYTGDVDFGASAEFDMFAEQLRWFNQTLKGEDTGILQEKPVRLFIMGGGNEQKNAAGRMQVGGEWVTSKTWPPAGVTRRAYYFRVRLQRCVHARIAA